MNIKDATDAILNFAGKADEGTVISYQLQSYQTHNDYTRTLACCTKKPSNTLKLDERLEKLLITEVIGLQTLLRWIGDNSFGLSTVVSADEENKVYSLWKQI